ncbi:hypothetical protein [Serratia rubidaea]|uniref:hypothetical protein n=1 Tax=Serratia rubidaea TaxID=61652 RepID=UPI0007730F2A|nr:hypothetical protein [Serratia rubidaea]
MDVLFFPRLLYKPYRLALTAANSGAYKMSDNELRNFLFTQTCVILSGVLAAREGQPMIIQQRFSKVYKLLEEEYEKLN